MFTTDDTANVPILDQRFTSINDFTKGCEGVAKLLASLNPNKASGDDSIAAKAIQGMCLRAPTF